MDPIRSWSYSRLNPEDVWDWESGDLDASEWPLPQNDALVSSENEGYRTVIRGVYQASADAEVLPRRVAVTDDGLCLELEEVRENVDSLVVDVLAHNPFKFTVEFDHQLDESDIPHRTVVKYYRTDEPFFQTVSER